MLLTATVVLLTGAAVVTIVSWLQQDMRAHHPCYSYDAIRTRARYRRNPAVFTMGRAWSTERPTPKGGRAPGWKS